MTPGQLSEAVIGRLTGALVAMGHVDVAAVLMLAGPVMTGGCVSLIVTVKEQPDEFPDASITVQTTVVAPLGKNDPEAGEQTGAPTPGQLSVTAGTE